jgi:hypothetical protein
VDGRLHKVFDFHIVEYEMLIFKNK